MFTGLVQAVGVVDRTEPSPVGVRLSIDPRGWNYRPAPGDSIAVAGCCLTVAVDPGSSAGRLVFDVVRETLAKTTLSDLAPGSSVNLEPSVTPATLLGGHLVQGHVDGVGGVETVRTGPEHRVRIRPPGELMEYMTPKGSVCLDGVSLTLAAVYPNDGAFEVALIPTTLARTTLGGLRPGGRCNIEADATAKTIVHWLRHYGPGPRGNNPP